MLGEIRTSTLLLLWELGMPPIEKTPLWTCSRKVAKSWDTVDRGNNWWWLLERQRLTAAFRIEAVASDDTIPCMVVVGSWHLRDGVVAHDDNEEEEEEDKGAYHEASWGDDCGDDDDNSCILLVDCRVVPMVLLGSGNRTQMSSRIGGVHEGMEGGLPHWMQPKPNPHREMRIDYYWHSPWWMDAADGADADADCSMGHWLVDLVASNDDHDAASVLREDSIQLRMVASRSNRTDAAWAFFPHDGSVHDGFPHHVVDAEEDDEGNETIEWCGRRREAFSCCGLCV